MNENCFSLPFISKQVLLILSLTKNYNYKCQCTKYEKLSIFVLIFFRYRFIIMSCHIFPLIFSFSSKKFKLQCIFVNKHFRFLQRNQHCKSLSINTTMAQQRQNGYHNGATLPSLLMSTAPNLSMWMRFATNWKKFIFQISTNMWSSSLANLILGKN